MDINVMIVEDNPLTSQDLKEIILENGMNVTGIAKNRSEALDTFSLQKPDILLMDINLKGGDNGIDLINEINKYQVVPTVFLTANSDRETVDRALLTKPASYLTKPYDEKDVIIALELAFKNHCQKAVENETKTTSLPIFLKYGTKYEKVQLKEILYLKAEGSYTQFVTQSKNYVLSCNLNQSFKKVGNGVFHRIHRSYVVNIENITSLGNEAVYIGEEQLPIGRSFKENINKVLTKLS